MLYDEQGLMSNMPDDDRAEGVILQTTQKEVFYCGSQPVMQEQFCLFLGSGSSLLGGHREDFSLEGAQL